jgi:hypothetical protein|tara:strand:+ start:491 stop:1084 length:594 start_codon:yes stop_codon:yes gene_type:complete
MYDVKLKAKYKGKKESDLYPLLFSGGDIINKLDHFKDEIKTIKKGGDRQTTLSRNVVKTKTLQRIGSQILNNYKGFNKMFDDCILLSKDEVKEMGKNFSETVKKIIDDSPSYNKTEFEGKYDHLPYHHRIIQLCVDDFKQSKYFKSMSVYVDKRDELEMERKFIEDLLQNKCDVNSLKYNEEEVEVENEEVSEEVTV